MLTSGFSIRKTAKSLDISKTTIQNYKKYGPPYLRKHLQNTPIDNSGYDQINLLLNKIEESEQREKKLLEENSTIKLENKDLRSELDNKNHELIKKKKEYEHAQKKAKEDLNKAEESLAWTNKEKEAWKLKYYESKHIQQNKEIETTIAADTNDDSIIFNMLRYGSEALDGLSKGITDTLSKKQLSSTQTTYDHKTYMPPPKRVKLKLAEEQQKKFSL